MKNKWMTWAGWLFCGAFCLCVADVAARETKSGGGSAPSAAQIFHADKLEYFKRFVVNYTTCDTIHREFIGMLSYTNAFRMPENIVYVDTAAYTIPCTLRLEVNRRGKILDCAVEGLDEPLLAERMRVAVEECPEGMFDTKALRRSGLSEVAIPLELPMAGNYIVVEDGLYRQAENENFGLTYRYNNRGPLTMAQHANLVYSAMGREAGSYALCAAGHVRFSFVVTTEGVETGFVKYEDALYAEGAFEDWAGETRRSTGAGWFARVANRWDWTPARVDGVAVPVKVVMHIDYDKHVYGWRCYLLSPEEERVIPRQTEMLSE